MIQNINNDHPILLGTDFYKLSKKHVSIIKETLRTTIKVIEIEIELMEKTPDDDSTYVTQLKEKYVNLIFAENHLRN